MPSFILKTPPAVEPVTLDELKAHARIDTTADNSLATSLITAARQWAERYTGRAFINQTWLLWFDEVPEGVTIKLPRPPLSSVTSVKTYDDSDSETLWSSDNYFVDTASDPGRLALRDGASWPIPSRLKNGIVIEYVAGYGGSATNVPEPIRLAIKQLATHWYEHRGEAVIMSATRHGAVSNMGAINVPFVIQALLDSYRMLRMGA